MRKPSAARPNALPDQAKRAAEPEVCEVEVRDADGRLLRTADQEHADQLVAQGAAAWYGYGSGRHVRLRVALPPNSRRTFWGHSVGRGNGEPTFRHNHAGCRTWPQAPVTGSGR